MDKSLIINHWKELPLVYISGLYSVGSVKHNIKNARRAAIELWERRFAVHCPHLNTAHFEQDCKAAYEDYLRGDLKIISRCDVILMIGEWRRSPGARTEREFALNHGIRVFYNMADLITWRRHAWSKARPK